MTNKDDLFGRIIKWSRNHPIVVVIVILGLFVIYVGSFTDALDKIFSFKEKYLTDRELAQNEFPLVPSENKVIEKSRSQASDPVPNTISATETKEKTKEHRINVKDNEPKTTTTIPKTIVSDRKPPKKKLEIQTRSPSNETQKIASTRIRQSVSLAVAALVGETTSDRVRSVRALLQSLPADLNAREITLLLGSETTSHREQILELLVPRARPRSLVAADIPDLLGSETTSNRINCISIVAPYIKPDIPGFVAAKILGSETLSHRVRALKPIGSSIRRPLSENEIAAILEGTSTSDRTQAINLLFSKASETAN